jgi:hypothetical protein
LAIVLSVLLLLAIVLSFLLLLAIVLSVHNDLQNIHHTYKTKDRVTRTPLKPGVNSGAPEVKVYINGYSPRLYFSRVRSWYRGFIVLWRWNSLRRCLQGYFYESIFVSIQLIW